jgi:hypothetical protein
VREFWLPNPGELLLIGPPLVFRDSVVDRYRRYTTDPVNRLLALLAAIQAGPEMRTLEAGIRDIAEWEVWRGLST